MLDSQQYESKEFKYLCMHGENDKSSLTRRYYDDEFEDEKRCKVSGKDGSAEHGEGDDDDDERFVSMQKQFEEWLLDMEHHLDTTCRATIQENTPEKLKGITKEITTRFPTLEDIVTTGNEVLGSKQGIELLDFKQQICTISDRWDNLYDKSQKMQQNVVSQLHAWFNYKEKYAYFKKYLDDVEGNLSLQKCKSSEELTARISLIKVFLEELKSKNKLMNELLQEGSRLPNKFEFISPNQIQQELADLGNHFRSKLEDVSLLISKQETLLHELCAMTARIDNFMGWFCRCKSVVEECNDDPYEQGLDGLVQLQAQLKDLMKQLAEKKPLFKTLCRQALHFEIKARGIIEVPHDIHQINLLKRELPKLERSLPITYDEIGCDIKEWRELDEKLVKMLAFIERTDIVVLQNGSSCEEIDLQLVELEERQKELATHHAEFSDILKATERVPLSSSSYFTGRIKILTGKWHNINQLTSERYQLLSLSQHYRRSSLDISKHLEKIEKKFDLPASIQSKVKKENRKAREMIGTLQSRVQILNLELIASHKGTANESNEVKNTQIENHLAGLNEEWTKLLVEAETSCHENEQVTKKWRHLTKLKKRFLNWINNKEEAASDKISKASFNCIVQNVSKYEELLKGITARKCDMDSLLSTAQAILDPNEQNNFILEVEEKFVKLEYLVNERHQYCTSLFEKWKKIQERKNRLNAIMKASSWLSGCKKITSAKELETCSEEYQIIVKKLNSIKAEVEHEFPDQDEIADGIQNIKDEICKQVESIEEIKTRLVTAHSGLSEIIMIKERISSWCDTQKKKNDEEKSTGKDIIEAELHSKLDLLKECNTKAKKVLEDCARMFAPGVVTEQLLDMKNDIDEVSKAFQIPLNEIVVIDDANYINNGSSNVETMEMIWEDNSDVPTTIMEILVKNQLTREMEILPSNFSCLSKKICNIPSDACVTTSNDIKSICDTSVDKDKEAVNSVPIIQITEHISENNFFLHDEYVVNGNDPVSLVDVSLEVGKLMDCIEEAIEATIFKVDQPKKNVNACDVDSKLPDVIMNELDTFDLLKETPKNTNPYSVNALSYKVQNLTFDSDFDITLFQNLLASFQRNVVCFSKHITNGLRMTQLCSRNASKTVHNLIESSPTPSSTDTTLVVYSTMNGSTISTNYPDELLEIVRNIKKCLSGLNEKMICLLDMSTKLHIYQYTAEEITLLQKNLSHLYNIFKPVHDHLNSKLDSIAEIKDEYVSIESTITDQEVWLKEALTVFSIEVMAITDENKIFDFMENKSRYQHELMEMCEVTANLFKRMEKIQYFDVDFLGRLEKLKTGEDELSRLSDSQDQRFENDMEKEDKFYQKAEEFVTWIGRIKEGRDDDEDIAIVFANHNALVSEIEKKAVDLTWLNSLGKELLDLASTVERRHTFSSQLEEIRLEWNQLLEQMSEKEILLANIYKVRPRNFAKMLVAKSQLEVEGKAVSPPIGIVLTSVTEDDDNVLSISISQQNATKGDSDDICPDSLLDLPSEMSIPMDSFDNTLQSDPENGDIPDNDVPTTESLEENDDLLCEPVYDKEDEDGEEDEATVEEESSKSFKEDASDEHNPNPDMTSIADEPAIVDGRCTSSLKDFSNEMIQTSQKNIDQNNDGHSSSESSIENINIKLKIDIQDDIDEEERDLDVEAIVFYVEDILLQIGKILNQSDDCMDSMEMRIVIITKNINTLLQLSSDLTQSLIKLEQIDNALYAMLIGNLIKRVTGILEFLEPYIEALTSDLEKLTHLVELYRDYSNSVTKYNDNIDALEKLVISELDSVDSFVGFKAVLDTAMNKMKGQAERLSEVITSIKNNVNKLPSEEKLILKKGIDDAILKTNELEKLVIDSKLDVDHLISEFASVEEKLKPIKRWVNKTKNIIRTSNCEMREKINEKCVEYTASIYDLFKYSSSFLHRLPKTDQNNLKMRFEMLFKSLKDIKTLLDSTPVGENSYGQTNTKSMFLSMLTICTANTRFLLDKASDAALENESNINIDQFLTEMKFLEENTSEITNQFGEYLHCFKKSELKSTSCDLINMLDQQVQIKTLLYDVDVQQSEKLLNSLLLSRMLNESVDIDGKTPDVIIQNTFHNAKLMVLLLYKHQVVINNLNQEICILPNLLVDAFSKKDFYLNTIEKYEELFKQICSCQKEVSARLSEIENSEFNKVIASVNQEYKTFKDSLDIYLEFLNFAQEIKLEVEVMIDVASRTIQEVKHQLLKVKLVQSAGIKCELLTPILVTLKNLIVQGKSIRNVNLQLLPKIDKEQIDYILWELRIKVNRLFESVSRTRKQCESIKLQKVISVNVAAYLFSESRQSQKYFHPQRLSHLDCRLSTLLQRLSCSNSSSVDPWKLVQLLLTNLTIYKNESERTFQYDSVKYNTHNSLHIHDNNLENNLDWQINRDGILFQNTEHISLLKNYSTSLSEIIQNKPLQPIWSRSKESCCFNKKFSPIPTDRISLNQLVYCFEKKQWMIGLQNTSAVSAGRNYTTAGQFYTLNAPVVTPLAYQTGTELENNINNIRFVENLCYLDEFDDLPLVQPDLIFQPVFDDSSCNAKSHVGNNINICKCSHTMSDPSFGADSKFDVLSPTKFERKTFDSNHPSNFMIDKTVLNTFSDKRNLDSLDQLLFWGRFCLDYPSLSIHHYPSSGVDVDIGLENFVCEKDAFSDGSDKGFELPQDIYCWRNDNSITLESDNEDYLNPIWQLPEQNSLERKSNDVSIWDKNDYRYRCPYESMDNVDGMTFRMLFKEIEEHAKERKIDDDGSDDLYVSIEENKLLKEHSQDAIYNLHQMEKAIGHCPDTSLIANPFHMGTSLFDLPLVDNVSSSLPFYFENAVQLLANISRDYKVQIGESRFRQICPSSQIIAISHQCSDIFNIISPSTVTREDIRNDPLPQQLHTGTLGKVLQDVFENKTIVKKNTMASPYHRLCVSPELSEEISDVEESELAWELPFPAIEDDYFMLDDIKCDLRSPDLSDSSNENSIDVSDASNASNSSDLKNGGDIQTAVISILEAAVLQLNEYEKLEIGYQEFKSIDEALEITDKLNFSEALSELIKCEVLILSLKDQIPDAELDELLEETAVLQKYFSDTCDDLAKWKRKLGNLKTQQYDYEIELYGLLCKLTDFRERIIEDAKISLNSISKQLNVDKQTLLKLKEEVNSVKQTRLNIEKRLPEPVKEELKLMETEFSEELNAMFCNVYKEEAYAKELMTNKLNLAQSISKVSYTLRVFQEHFKEVVQSEKTNSFEDMRKMLQELVKINDDWEHDKNEIKKLILMLPHEDIKNIEASNTHIAGIFKYVQEELKNNPMLINYFLDIDKRLAIWAQKFAGIETMQKYDQTLVLQEQLKINEMLMSLVNEYSVDLTNIFKDIEVTFSLNVVGYTNNDKHDKMKLCAATYQNNIKEVELFIRAKINNLTEAQCNLDSWFTRKKELEQKINGLLDSWREHVLNQSKHALLEEIYNEYYQLTGQFDEIKMQLPMGNLIAVQQSISFIRNRINIVKEKEVAGDVDDDQSSVSTTPMSEDNHILDLEDFVQCRGFGDFGGFGEVKHRKDLTEMVKDVDLKFIVVKKSLNTLHEYFKAILPDCDKLISMLHSHYSFPFEFIRPYSATMVTKLNLSQHKLLSLHSFHADGVTQCFILSKPAAHNVLSRIVPTYKDCEILTAENSSKHPRELPLRSVQRSKKIFVCHHENTQNLIDTVNSDPRSRNEVLILPNTCFDSSQFDLLRSFTHAADRIYIDVSGDKLYFTASLFSARSKPFLSRCKTSGRKDEKDAADDERQETLFEKTVTPTSESITTDSVGYDLSDSLDNHCDASDRHSKGRSSLHPSRETGKKWRVKSFHFNMDEKVKVWENRDSEEVEKGENDCFNDNEGLVSSSTNIRSSAIDMHIKHIQNEHIDNAVTRLCDEVQLLTEEDIYEVSEPEINVISNKLAILKDLVASSPTNKAYLQENIDAAEITLFHLAMQLQKPTFTIESINEESIEPDLLDSPILQAYYNGSKDISPIHSISLDPITELDEDSREDISIQSTELPFVEEKDIVPVTLQPKMMQFDSNIIFSEKITGMKSSYENEIIANPSFIVEENIVPITLHPKPLLFNDEVFSESSLSYLDLMPESGKNIRILDQELIDAILQDNPLILNSSASSPSPESPPINEDEIIPVAHQNDTGSVSDILYQPSQLFQQAFPGYFTELVQTESCEKEKFVFKSVTSIYELNETDENSEEMSAMEDMVLRNDMLLEGIAEEDESVMRDVMISKNEMMLEGIAEEEEEEEEEELEEDTMKSCDTAQEDRFEVHIDYQGSALQLTDDTDNSRSSERQGMSHDELSGREEQEKDVEDGMKEQYHTIQEVNSNVFDVFEGQEAHSNAFEGQEVHSNVLEDEEVHSNVIEDPEVHSNVIEDQEVHSNVIEDPDVHSNVLEDEEVHSNVIEDHEAHSNVPEDRGNHSVDPTLLEANPELSENMESQEKLVFDADRNDCGTDVDAVINHPVITQSDVEGNTLDQQYLCNDNNGDSNKETGEVDFHEDRRVLQDVALQGDECIQNIEDAMPLLQDYFEGTEYSETSQQDRMYSDNTIAGVEKYVDACEDIEQKILQDPDDTDVSLQDSLYNDNYTVRMTEEAVTAYTEGVDVSLQDSVGMVEESVAVDTEKKILRDSEDIDFSQKTDNLCSDNSIVSDKKDDNVLDDSEQNILQDACNVDASRQDNLYNDNSAVSMAKETVTLYPEEKILPDTEDIDVFQLDSLCNDNDSVKKDVDALEGSEEKILRDSEDLDVSQQDSLYNDIAVVNVEKDVDCGETELDDDNTPNDEAVKSSNNQNGALDPDNVIKPEVEKTYEDTAAIKKNEDIEVLFEKFEDSSYDSKHMTGMLYNNDSVEECSSTSEKVAELLGNCDSLEEFSSCDTEELIGQLHITNERLSYISAIRDDDILKSFDRIFSGGNMAEYSGKDDTLNDISSGRDDTLGAVLDDTLDDVPSHLDEVVGFLPSHTSDVIPSDEKVPRLMLDSLDTSSKDDELLPQKEDVAEEVTDGNQQTRLQLNDDSLEDISSCDEDQLIDQLQLHADHEPFVYHQAAFEDDVDAFRYIKTFGCLSQDPSESKQTKMSSSEYTSSADEGLESPRSPTSYSEHYSRTSPELIHLPMLETVETIIKVHEDIDVDDEEISTTRIYKPEEVLESECEEVILSSAENSPRNIFYNGTEDIAWDDEGISLSEEESRYYITDNIIDKPPVLSGSLTEILHDDIEKNYTSKSSYAEDVSDEVSSEDSEDDFSDVYHGYARLLNESDSSFDTDEFNDTKDTNDTNDSTEWRHDKEESEVTPMSFSSSMSPGPENENEMENGDFLFLPELQITRSSQEKDENFMKNIPVEEWSDVEKNCESDASDLSSSVEQNDFEEIVVQMDKIIKSLSQSFDYKPDDSKDLQGMEGILEQDDGEISVAETLSTCDGIHSDSEVVDNKEMENGMDSENEVMEMPDEDEDMEMPDENKAMEVPDEDEAKEIPVENESKEMLDENKADEIPDECEGNVVEKSCESETDVRTDHEISSDQNIVDTEIPDEISASDLPTTEIEDPRLESSSSLDKDDLHSQISHPVCPDGVDMETPSLFSELIVVEDERVKDFAFQEMAEKLHASLGIKSDMTDSTITKDTNGFECDDLPLSEVDEIMSSTPIRIEDASNVFDYQSMKRNVDEIGNHIDHAERTGVDRSFSSEISNYDSKGIRIVLESDHFPSSNMLDLVNQSSFSTFNCNTSSSLPLVADSPLYGKERDMCISHTHGVEEEDMGLNAFYTKIQKCMISMVEISSKLNLGGKNEIGEEFDLREKIEILALLGSQQSQIDSLNICGAKTETQEDVMEKIQEKLNIMNENWSAIQEKAYKIVYLQDTLELGSSNCGEEMKQKSLENKYTEYECLLSELADRLPVYEEELGVPLSLYSTSEIQWKVSRLQDACQYIKGKQLPLEYLYTNFIAHESNENTQETYKDIMEKSSYFYEELTTKLQSLSLICFKMLSFESLKLYLLSWLDRLEETSIKPLLEKEENDFESIDDKLFKLTEIEKRFSDKYQNKERLLNNANTLIASIDNSELKASVRSITIRWENICLLLKELRSHLDSVAYLWRQFTHLSESLEQWLTMNLSSIKASLEHSSIDSVKFEIELIRNLQNELDLKQHDKEALKGLRTSLSQCINGKACHIVNLKMADLENMWLELKCSLQERVEHLALLIDEVEMVNINDMVVSVTKCIQESEDEMARYDESPGKSVDDVEEGIKTMQNISLNLNNQRHSLDFLLQLSADYKWHDKAKFQTETMMLQDNFEVVVNNVEQKTKLLKALVSKITMIENMVEDIVCQLSEVDDSLNTCMELIEMGNLDKSRENVKVSSKTISNLAQTVEYVNKSSKGIAKDYRHNQLDIVDQSEKLLEHFQGSNEKLANVNMKLSGFSSYESISNELEVLQNYVNQAREMAESLQKVDITQEKLIQIRKQLKDYKIELPSYEDRIGNLYNSLLALMTDNHVHPMVAQWLQVSKTILKNLSELAHVFEKKEQQVEVIMTSLVQYDEDHNELSDWLAEKEQQYETLQQQANSSTFKMKLPLGNKCKKLKDDMSVFVTFSESMQSLFYNKNRFCSCQYVTKKQEELNTRYEMLKMQVIILYERVIKSNQKSAVCEVVLKNIQQWLDKVERQELKSTMSLDMAGQVIQTTISESYRYQYQLEEMLNNPDDVSEKERKDDVEFLLERLELLVTDLQYNGKQIEKLQKEVETFDIRATETTSIINALKQDFKRRSHLLSFESFKTQKSLVVAKLDQLKSFSQSIIHHACITNDIKMKIDNQLIKVNDMWSHSLKEFNKMEEFDSNDLDTWKEFDGTLKTLMEWVTAMREKIYGMEYKLSGSSIEMLKNSYSGILALRDEFIDQRVLYDKLIKASKKLIESNDVIAENVRKSVLNTEITWTELELVVMKQLDDTKNILQQWTSYTSEMKNLMRWLRSFEKEIKPTHHRLSWKDLELMCHKFQSMSKQFETKEGNYETIKMHMAALSRVAIMDDQILLQHQMSSLSQLWQSLKRQLKEKMKTLKKLLSWVESFSHNHKVFETWLNGVEQSLYSSEFISDPEKQKQRIKLIYSEDLAKYDLSFGELRNTAVQILTYGSTCTFASDIQDKFICINKRWKQLCQKLGLAHKNVEETIFMLQLLEEMLKQLTTWLSRVMERLKEVDLDSCSIEYMEESLADVQDLIIEFNNQDQDFQSIKEIYLNIQESHNANVYMDDLDRLLKHSEHFKTKWTETRNKIHMYKSYLLNRVAIFNEWMKEVSTMGDWIDTLGTKFDTNGIYVDKHKILEDFTIANKSLERIKKTCEHLTIGSNCVASKKIIQTTRSIESKFEEITSDYNYINKMNMNHDMVSYGCQEDDAIELEHQLERWLTEVEIKLISLRPFTSVDDEDSQLAQLKELNNEIKEKGCTIDVLSSRLANRSSMKMITLHGTVEELRERFDLALKESAMWIENLKRPRLLSDLST